MKRNNLGTRIGHLEKCLRNGCRKRQVMLVVSHSRLVLAVLTNLEGSMGTAHGAEELGLCSHGHACQTGAWGGPVGPLHRILPRIWPYLAKNQKWSGRQKYSVRPIVLSHDEILTNRVLWVNFGTLQMRIAVSRE